MPVEPEHLQYTYFHMQKQQQLKQRKLTMCLKKQNRQTGFTDIPY